MDSALGRERVTEKFKKHVSKWDLIAGTQYPSENVQDNSKLRDAVDTYHDEDLNSGWNLSKSASSNFPRTGSNVLKWSARVANNTLRSKSSSGGSCWEHMPEGNNDAEDVSVYRGGDELVPTARTWGRDQSHRAYFAPHVDAWRQRSRSRSPGWGWQCRSRSMSPHDFRHRAKSWNSRDRSGRGGSTEQYRDFATGWCRRGDQCRFLHQDDHDYDGRGRSDYVRSENRRLRQEKGRFSRYADIEAFTLSQEEIRYPWDEDMHGYESRLGGREKHELQRNNGSSARRNDFLKGKCYRGSACKYVHSVNAVDYDEWSSKDEARERAHNRREDLSFGHYQRHEPHRSINSLCKYFAEGYCRNGERCRFSHQGVTFGGPRERFQDGRWGDYSVVGNRSRGCLKGSDNNGGAGVCYPENHLWNNRKWGDKEAEKNVSGFSSRDNNNVKVDDPQDKLWEGPKWDDKAVEEDVSISSQRKRKDDGTRGIVPESMAADQFGNGTNLGSPGANRNDYPQRMGREKNIDNSKTSCAWNPEAEGEQQHVLTTLMQGEASGNAHVQEHPDLQAVAAVFTCEGHKKFTDSAEAQNGANFFGNNLPVVVPVPEQSPFKSEQKQQILPPSPTSIAQCLDSSEQNKQIAFPPSNIENLNPEKQSEEIIPSSPDNFSPCGGSQQITHALQNEQSFDLNSQSPPISRQMGPSGQCQEKILHLPLTDHSRTFLGNEDLSKKPDLLDVSVSQLSYEISSAENETVTEKGVQLTDLSASLAQIFGNGQQLPQLYATLNHLSACGLVPAPQISQSNSVRPSAPTAALFVHSNHGSLPRNQCDRLHNTVESVKPDISNASPRFPRDTHEMKNTSCDQSQPPQQNLALPIIVTGGPNESSPPENVSLEKSNNENHDNQCGPSMDTEVVEVNGATTVQCEKSQQNGLLEDIDAVGRVHEEGDRSKEPIGMRMFKFTLVEFVKELLKPTWKEGRMSKEAHKTIVKKVVDKVTGTVQGPHIPHTQEQIEHYLSFSKPKLTKLVNAYVEKYLKT